MLQQAIVSLIGDTQSILMRSNTVSGGDETPPFGFINIYAVKQQDTFTHLHVDLKIVATGNDAPNLADFADSFDIQLNNTVHIPTELLIRQINMLNFAYNTDFVSDDEIEVIRDLEIPANLQTKDSLLITEFHMHDNGVDYQGSANMIHATHLTYSKTEQVINEILEKLATQNKV